MSSRFVIPFLLSIAIPICLWLHSRQSLYFFLGLYRLISIHRRKIRSSLASLSLPLRSNSCSVCYMSTRSCLTFMDEAENRRASRFVWKRYVELAMFEAISILSLMRLLPRFDLKESFFGRWWFHWSCLWTRETHSTQTREQEVKEPLPALESYVWASVSVLLVYSPFQDITFCDPYFCLLVLFLQSKH
jgi:hypothetical protein